MCGIVGYLGQKPSEQILLDALKTLEYRGYDSAGILTLKEREFKRFRAAGKLVNLEKKVLGQESLAHLGIAHTRWATHGPAIEKNAHPHVVGDVGIVHNGIIENYRELKAALEAQDCVFTSDTDSELVAHLLNFEIQKKLTLIEACLNVRKKLEGAYAILALSSQSLDEVVAFKQGPPLILGIGSDEFILASDLQAILPHTTQIVHFDDGDLVSVNARSKHQFYNSTDEKIEKNILTMDWSPEKAQKQTYPHFMLKEIYEQPKAVAEALKPHINLKNHEVEIQGIKDSFAETQKYFAQVERVFIVSCGTSFYGGLYGEYVLEQIGRVPVEVEVASEFRYRNPVLPPNSLVVFITQSGETADTLAALRLAKEAGVDTLSICNTPHSTIDRESDFSLYMNSGVEIGVASTKAFVSTLSVLALLGIMFGKSKKVLSAEEEQELVQSLLAVPAHIEGLLGYDAFFKEASEELSKSKGFLYLGRGALFPIAMEGALKLKELAYVHAEGYAAGEMKHGPLALIDKEMMCVVIAPQDHLYEKTISNLQEVKARGGQVISVGTVGDKNLDEMSNFFIPMPKAHWVVTPILATLPVQLMAYHLALSMGNDVDQPRNLAKSVTVE